MTKAIFLDRDGVINKVKLIARRPYPPKNINQLTLLPGVYEALQMLKDLGYLLIVVTNQPDVARGSVDIKTVEEINNFLKAVLPLTDIFTCYHDDAEGCNCRKPNPGNILEAVDRYHINVEESFLIGDRWRDIEAGQRAGCKTFFIDYGYDEKQPLNYTYKVKSLYQASEIILEKI
jgi:D-glycero-D-manno-heptose 1,7-bisphosphate phosphatase